MVFNPPWLDALKQNKILGIAVLIAVAVLFYFIHLMVRSKLINGVAKKLSTDEPYGNIANAFRKNTRWWRGIFRKNPVGWGIGVRKKLDGIRSDIDKFVQTLNDRYTSPSGKEDS